MRRSVLELTVVGGLIALLAAWGLGYGSPRVDWRQVTVEGFPVGVKPEQLEARLSRPEIRDGKATWGTTYEGTAMAFWSSPDGFHLRGCRLFLKNQIVAESWQPGRDLPKPREELTSSREIEEIFGQGKPISEDRALLFSDTETDHQLLIELGRFPGSDRRFPFSFEVCWPSPASRPPSVAGYSPGPSGYCTYADTFLSQDLCQNGRVILERRCSRAKVLAVLGPPSEESEETLFWINPGILARFYRETLGDLLVSGDPKPLLYALRQQRALHLDPKARDVP